MGNELKDVVWMGDSLDILREFPRAVRVTLGSEIYRLQSSESPADSKPISTVGSGVKELRTRDRNNQYRTIYVVKRAEGIVVLHAFVKKTQKTAKADIELAKQRFKAI